MHWYKTNMDFLDPKKRRTHAIRLFIGYGLVAIALLIGTAILALYAYGFDFNRKTGVVIQNGLVFVDAHPDSADIYLNTKPKGKTSSRLILAEGQYTIELKRTGYRSWKKQFTLEGSQIQRLVYPVLFPEKLITRDVQLYGSTPEFVTESPDRHWLLVQKPGSLTDFELYDVTTTTNDTVSVAFPSSIFTTATGTHHLELVEWSTDNRHVVVQHSWQGGVEYVLLDRESPGSSLNLTKTFPGSSVQFSLRDKKYDQYYLYDSAARSLATVDLRNTNRVTVLSDVISFKPYSADTILYVTDTGVSSGKVLVRVRSATLSYSLREITKSDYYLLDITRFNNHWYMVAGNTAEGRVYIFRDPVELTKRSPTSLPAPVAALRQDRTELKVISP
ncbi:PEGA domain-containing protein [Candidatus Saccharibacteria bacterium]|nr:PEGA domain-containing protein [Candidatus Saccharibacteria bacterium]